LFAPCFAVALAVLLAMRGTVLAQAYAPPDRSGPGDAMIQAYLAREAVKLDAKFADDHKSLADWNARRPALHAEYLHMLGLAPLPERTPLEANITGTLTGEGYVVEMLHFQSRPRLYVTANLYRPPSVPDGEKLPAVLYVCGHAQMGRNGNKTGYQSYGIWLARHGYVCLMLDTLQLGEIAAKHHGTHNLQRWWWHSRGYTPAGVECWNGVRAIDYLQSRPEVDGERLAVTGRSGGGAATFWIAAADERVKVAIPVSGMADLESYVGNRVINGHCDCMFLYNHYAWPWTRIAALVAPRPMLFVNGDSDAIFPMDANERISNRLERLYAMHLAGDRFDTLVSIGGHSERKDIRQGVCRFLNAHLKNDPREVTDTEIDVVVEEQNTKKYPIPPERLRVFASDADLPADELNSKIDESFVPAAQVAVPEAGKFDAWKKDLVAQLREVPFRYFPERIEPAKVVETKPDGTRMLATEEPIRVPLVHHAGPKPAEAKRVLLVVAGAVERGSLPWLANVAEASDAVEVCQVRGFGPTAWTRKNPPNYVERSHALLGRTVDAGRVWDAIAAARLVRAEAGGNVPVHVVGHGPSAVLAAYAALLEPEDIAGAILIEPPDSHQNSAAPQLLSVLRTCDVPDAVGMLAPRPLTIVGPDQAAWQKVADIYNAAGAKEQFGRKGP
jgi:dienelactone hydrolase